MAKEGAANKKKVEKHWYNLIFENFVLISRQVYAELLLKKERDLEGWTVKEEDGEEEEIEKIDLL